MWARGKSAAGANAITVPLESAVAIVILSGENSAWALPPSFETGACPSLTANGTTILPLNPSCFLLDLSGNRWNFPGSKHDATNYALNYNGAPNFYALQAQLQNRVVYYQMSMFGASLWFGYISYQNSVQSMGPGKPALGYFINATTGARYDTITNALLNAHDHQVLDIKLRSRHPLLDRWRSDRPEWHFPPWRARRAHCWKDLLNRFPLPLDCRYHLFRDPKRHRSVTGSEGGWHETLVTGSPFRGSSDRAFGLWFATIFAAMGALGLWQGRGGGPWWLVAAAVLLIGSIFFAPLLGPFNRVWQRFSLLLNKLVHPIIMSTMFFAVLTPVALLMRLFGKDPLRLRFEPSKPSYWIDKRADKSASMKNAF